MFLINECEAEAEVIILKHSRLSRALAIRYNDAVFWREDSRGVSSRSFENVRSFPYALSTLSEADFSRFVINNAPICGPVA